MFNQSAPTAAAWTDVVIAVPISLLLGLFVALVYKRVMATFDYSVSILHTLVYLSMIASLIMIVIGNDIARAFTLVGALAVIRFRTPIKDARDAAFLFLALAAGMGAGVGLYLAAASGTLLIGIFILLMSYLKFGVRAKGETLVKFSVPLNGAAGAVYHQEVFERFLRDHKLVNARSMPESGRLELTFLVTPLKTTDMVQFSRSLSSIPQIEKTSVIVCEDEDLPRNVY